jgi:hypothetical protein
MNTSNHIFSLTYLLIDTLFRGGRRASDILISIYSLLVRMCTYFIYSEALNCGVLRKLHGCGYMLHLNIPAFEYKMKYCLGLRQSIYEYCIMKHILYYSVNSVGFEYVIAQLLNVLSWVSLHAFMRCFFNEVLEIVSKTMEVCEFFIVFACLCSCIYNYCGVSQTDSTEISWRFSWFSVILILS